MNLKKLFTKYFLIIILSCATVFGKAQTVGDLAIIGVSSQSDTIKLITLNSIAASSTFTITDNPWIAANSALNTNEGYLTWTTPASVISAGTVITFTTSSTWNVNAAVTSGSVVVFPMPTIVCPVIELNTLLNVIE